LICFWVSALDCFWWWCFWKTRQGTEHLPNKSKGGLQMKYYTQDEFNKIRRQFKGKFKSEWGYLLIDEHGNRYIMDGINCEIYVLCDLWIMRDIALITDVYAIRKNSVVLL
jgi:hypothetical protein